MAKATSVASIQKRRGRSTPAALRKRRAAGENVDDTRAFVRVGQTATDVLTGVDDLSDWDDEELRRGRRRCRIKGSRWFGKFQGSDPIVVPKALHDELVKRTLDKANKLFQENLLAAVEVLVDLCTDTSVEPRDRLKAVQMITERVMGKPKDTVEFTGDKKWELALTGGIVHSVAGEDEDDDD